MMFSRPIPFAEAVASQAVKRLLPTTAGSAELARLAPEIRERARFSAMTSNLGYLARMDGLLTTLVSPASQDRDAGPVLDASSVRLQLKQHLAAIGYEPEPGKAGGLQDLSSDARLNLIIETNLKQAYGYGDWASQQDPDLLDVWPCQELIRAESREQERDWRSRWVSAGGGLYGGRMIARKDDPIWSDISRFGVPYPPFDFNSGMGVRDVLRSEAERLGVITPREAVAPQSGRLNEQVEAAIPPDVSRGLADAVLEAFRDVATAQAGRLLLRAIT